ncbi:MAG: hypothetical protein ACI8XM_002987 [Haloarculaceae archaeon]|jgi:hypothetical protein
MSRGIIGTLQLAASMLFAIPVGLFGVFKLMEGDLLLGVGFLVLAVGMVAVEELVTKPTDVLAAVAKRATGRVVETPDEEE